MLPCLNARVALGGRERCPTNFQLCFRLSVDDKASKIRDGRESQAQKDLTKRRNAVLRSSKLHMLSSMVSRKPQRKKS